MAVAERVAQADQRVARWRRRTVLLVFVSLAVAVAAAWALMRGPAAALAASPLEQGSIGGGPNCDSGVRSHTVEDTFGGGGTILDFVDGAQCEIILSIRNVASVPVTVVAIEQTDPEFIEPLRLTGATRNEQPVSAELDCYGCTDEYVPFTPMTVAPGDEWEVAVQGVMRGCRSPGPPAAGGTTMSRETVEMTVRVAGVHRTVAVELGSPFAVRSEGCSSSF